MVAGEEFEYLDIGKTLSLKKGFYPEHIAFWDEIYKMLQEKTVTPRDEL